MSTLLEIHCADKQNHHADAANPGIVPFFPARVCAAGRSNSGKGSTIKTLMMSATPAYDKIVVLHYDPTTLEWADVEPTQILTIDDYPVDPNELWDRRKKNALVIDELAFEGMNRANRAKIDRIVNYVCSHYSVSVFLIQQNFVSIPPAIRRAMDWWVIWPSVDNMSMLDISRKTGHDMKALSKLCKSKYDSITFDHTGDGPVVRLNLFTPVVER